MTSSRSPLAITLLALSALAGCDTSSPQEPLAGPTKGWVRFVEVKAPPAPGVTQLCDAIALASAGAGLYEVLELRANPTLDPEHLYIELNLLEAWTTLAPQNPTLRLPAGPDLMSSPWLFEIKEDQQLALMLLPQMTDNRDFWATMPSLVMRYDEQQQRMYSPALPQEGLRLPELSRQIAQEEARVERAYEAPRDFKSLDPLAPLPSAPECAL